MKPVTFILFSAGLTAAAGMVLWQGVGTVLSPIAHAGWWLTLIPVYFLVPLTCTAMAWRCLFVAPPPFGPLYSANWIGLAVNWLLPVAQVGGELVRARLLIKRGAPAAEVGATVIVDKTLQAVTLAGYGLAGITLLAALRGGHVLLAGALATTALLAVGIYFFYRVQRRGLFQFLATQGARFVRSQQIASVLGGARALDSELDRLYRRPTVLLASCAWRLAFRVTLAGEIWIGLTLIGYPIGLLEALILESLAQAVRGAAFAIPGALGAQEGGIVLLGAALGLPIEAGLALALVKRLREGVIGVPGLLTWQMVEGRRLFGRREAP